MKGRWTGHEGLGLLRGRPEADPAAGAAPTDSCNAWEDSWCVQFSTCGSRNAYLFDRDKNLDPIEELSMALLHRKAGNPLKALPLMRAPSVVVEHLTRDTSSISDPFSHAAEHFSAARYTWQDEDALAVHSQASEPSNDPIGEAAAQGEDEIAAAELADGLPPLPPELLANFPIKSILVKNRKYAPSDSPVKSKERTHRLTWDEPKNACLFVSPYDKDRLEEWFYTDEDFEEFERDASRKPAKKRASSGGRKKRARAPPPSPARGMGVEGEDSASSADAVERGAFEAALRALDGEATGQTQLEEEAADPGLGGNENRPKSGNVELLQDAEIDAANALLPPSKRRAYSRPMFTWDDPKEEEQPFTTTTSHPLASVASSSLASLAAPSSSSSRALPPTPLQATPAPELPKSLLLPPTQWRPPTIGGGKAAAGANPYAMHAAATALSHAPSAPTSLRARRESRESAFGSLGIEELKQKIRQVATTRRERLQGAQ